MIWQKMKWKKIKIMSILETLKENACNNRRERPASFTIGVISVAGGMLFFLYGLVWFVFVP